MIYQPTHKSRTTIQYIIVRLGGSNSSPECFRKTKLLAFFDESTFLDPSFLTYQFAQVEQT